MGEIYVDFSQTRARIRPLHGVNNGPVTYAFTYDHSEDFRRAHIPLCRLNDTEYPYGSGHFVDIPCVFPDFSADPEDPESYNFKMTDRYLQLIHGVGAKIIYRLGVSIEHGRIKYFVSPPKDNLHWARICEGVIRHYNEGWADGFRMGIDRWEIWNEPEFDGIWQGTERQYCELYQVAATHLKKRFPDIQVGGYGCSGFYPLLYGVADETQARYLPFLDEFLRYITDPAHPAPLDFFSWHCYAGASLDDVVQYARYARQKLDQYGFKGAESILDEWNYTVMPNQYDRMRTPEAAAALAAILINLQKHTDVSCAAYYDAQPAMIYCGLFSMTGLNKPYYTFLAFGKLYALGWEAFTECGGEGLYALAARDEHRGALFAVNPSGSDMPLRVEAAHFPQATGARLSVLDAARDLEEAAQYPMEGGRVNFEYTLPPHSFILVEFE